MADIQSLVDYLNIRRREREAEKANTTVSVLLIDQNYDSTNELNITEDDNMEPEPNFIDIEPSKLVWPLSVSWRIYQKNIYLRVVDDNNTPESLQYYQRHQYTNDQGQEIVRYKNYADLSQWIALDESEIITIPMIHDKGRYYYLSNTNRVVINYSLDKTFLFQDKFFFNPADIPEIKTGSDYSLDYVDHEGYADSGLDALWRFLFFSDDAYKRNIKNRQVTIKNTQKTGDVFILPDIYYRQGRYVLSYRKADERFTKSSFKNSEIYLQLTFNYLGTMMEFLYQTVFKEGVLSLDSITDNITETASYLALLGVNGTNRSISNYIEDSFTNIRSYFLSKYLQMVEDEIPWRGSNVEDALEVLYYTSDIFLEYMSAEVLWEIVGKALEQNLDNIGLNEEDVMLILLGALRKKGETADVFLNTLLKKKTNDGSSYFSKLYDKLNTSSFSRFIYLLLDEWNKSSYSDPGNRKFYKNGDEYINPIVCGYTSGTSWSFNYENTNFTWKENDYIEVKVTTQDDTEKTYVYHPYDLIAISNAANEGFSFTGKKLDQINLIPAFTLFAHSDVTFWENVTLTAEYVGDVISVAVGLGPAWRSFRILSALTKATTTAQKAFVITRSAVGVMEVTAGTANIILKATELRKTEFGESLASVFMWMEFASLGTDVAVGIAKRLSASAKRALGEADKLLKNADKPAGSSNKTNKTNKPTGNEVKKIGGLPEPEFKQLGHLLLGQLEGVKYIVAEEFKLLAGAIAKDIKAAGVQILKFTEDTLKTLDDFGDEFLRYLGINRLDPQYAIVNSGYLVTHNGKGFLASKLEDVKGFFNAMSENLNKGASKGRRGGKNINKVDEAFNNVIKGFSKTQSILSKGKIIAKFTKGKELELIGKNFKKIYGSSKILLKKDATVAITGLLNDVREIKKLGFKIKDLWKQGINIGGTDLLSSPIWFKIKDKWKHLELSNPKLYWQNVTNDFWNQANKPWLDDIIERGDDVRFVSDPKAEKSIYVWLDDINEFATGLDGEKVKTIFGREVDYMLQNGYKIEGDIAIKIKN
ncbi:hypothetical protein [Kordia sp.]|uniref:hypothetical protein n=1 Tax=Kordia sp. TaxID=1965332 RepID=UPI003D6B5168